MARFRYKHIQSTVENKIPSDLLDGELAVNRFKGKEKIFLKNASGEVVSFSSDSVIDALVGSGFTSSSITDVIIENEEIVSNALTDLDERKLDASAYTPTDLSNYYTKDETSGKTELTTAFNSKASQSTVDTLNGTVTAHTANTEIHVTSADKTTWNAKVDASAIANFFDDAKYEDSGTTKVINFYHGNTIKATIDATDFIKDGMIDTVSAGTSGSTTVLVITWNTDAGKSQTILDIGDMFEADNYYTKSETSGKTEISDALADKIASGDVVTAITESNSGSSAPVSVKVVAENEFVVSTALNDLNANKLDVTAYTPTDLSNYYTKSQTSGATELSTAFNAKANTATTLAGYGITDAYTKTEIDNKLGTGFTVSSITEVIESNERVTASALNDLNTNKLDVSAYTPTDLSNYYTKSETSGATEISNALEGKVNTSEYATFSAETNASINDLSGQSETIAAALNNLNENKLDITAYTPTDLSNYYTKSETSGATEISTAFDAVNTSINDLSGQSETIAAALNNLNENKLDSTALNGYATKSGDLDGVVLKKITQSAYDALVQAGTVDPNTLYIITD